jgi:hypothetical protein
MPRWLRIFLTILAAIVGGYVGLIIVGGGAAGIAWLYLFGDDPWPRWSEIAIPLVALAGSVAGALALGLAIWRSTGKYRS